MSEILRLSLPMTLWLVGFSAVYGLQGFSCSRHWPVGLDARLVLIGVGAIFVMAQAAMLLAVLRAPSRSRFVQGTAATLAFAALVAGMWTMLPLLVTSVCR